MNLITELTKLIKAFRDVPDTDLESILMKAEEKRRKYWKDWEAPENLTSEQEASVQQFLDQGYSPREAHRHAGAHIEHRDIRRAMKSGIAPSSMSDIHMGSLKEIAQAWLGHADKYDKLNADVSKNPDKAAAGHLIRAHEDAMGDYQQDYHSFLASDKVKDLKGRDRHAAINQWKKQWKDSSPDHYEKLANMSEANVAAGDIIKGKTHSLEEKMDHIISGGISPGDSMSSEEAMQHIGASRGEDDRPAGITTDPSAKFAQDNPRLREMMSQEMNKKRADRLKQIQSAKAAQATPENVSAPAPAPAPKEFTPQVVRRRKDQE